MITRKDLNALATELKDNRPGANWSLNKQLQWQMDVKSIARVCRSSNPNFDYGRFITACGGLFNVLGE
jgi:hypothetical protein